MYNTEYSLLYLWPVGLLIIVFLGLIFYFNNLIRLLILLELFILSNSTFLIVLIFSSDRPEIYDLLGAVPIFLAAAAADAAVGLGILVVLFRYKKNLHPEEAIDTNG